MKSILSNVQLTISLIPQNEFSFRLINFEHLHLPLSNKDVQVGKGSEHSGANAPSAQPTVSVFIAQLIQAGQPAPGLCDEEFLLEPPPEDDFQLGAIASAEAIRRRAQTSSDQDIMNSDEQVV
jgi:hypothetical protein